jgi:hypothetical protein
MERLDTAACHDVAAAMAGTAPARSGAPAARLAGGAAPPVLTSETYDMYQLVSILRACDWMVSSRYHGIVTCMPGLVASAGITMDERIRNLMQERGHERLFLEVDDPNLEGKLYEVLCMLASQTEEIRDGIGHSVVRNLQVMARMGSHFEAQVQRCYPEFPVRHGVYSWEEYLPRMSPQLSDLVTRYS